MSDTLDAVLNIRVTDEIAEAIAEIGAFYGRSAAAEARIALRAHLRAHNLYLADHHGAEIQRDDPDLDLDSARAEAEESLEQLYAQAFTRPTPRPVSPNGETT